MKKRIFLTSCLLCTLLLNKSAYSQSNWPSQPVKIIAPYAAGGPVDIVARLIGRKLQDALQQSVIVENRAGAGGNLGSDMVAKSTPDGHTLLFNTSAVLIAPLIGQRVGFDPMRDFVPVVKVGVVPALLVVSTSVEAKSVGALIAEAREKPGVINFASPGPGSSLHLAGELFAKMANVKLTHIPFKGGAEALPRLIAGDVQMMFDPITEALPLVKAGKLRMLAISTKDRSPSLPHVPTVAESGVLGYDFSVWYGLFAPAKTPASVIDRLAREALKILELPDVREALEAKGITVIGQGPQEFGRAYSAEQKTWSDLITSTGLKIE